MENVWGHAEALVAAWGLKVLAALVIIILGRWTAKLCRNGLRRVLEKADTDPTLVGFFTSGAHVALMVVVVLAALNQRGVQTTSFIAIIGAAPWSRKAMSATTTDARPIANPMVYWAIFDEAMLQSVSK